MKVFIIARGYPFNSVPPIGIFEYEQAHALRELGHNVVYLSLDLRSIRRKRKLGYSSFSKDGVKIENYALPVGAVPRDVLVWVGKFALKHLMKIAIKKHGKPDIIHVHFFDLAAIAAKCDFGDIPIIVTEHSSQLNAEIPEEKKLKYIVAYEHADAVITVSQDLKKRLQNLLNVESVCINNMVNLSKFTFKEKKQNDCFTFVTVSKLDNNKRVDLIIDSFNAFLFDKDKSKFKLFIVGVGEEEVNLREMIQTYNLEENVVFYGFLPKSKINELFHESDCFVLASKKETFGVACAEALVTGTPVIITHSGGPEEFVDESNGVITKDAEMADAMNYVYENYMNYDKVAISEGIINRFNEETIAHKIEELYKDVIRKKGH